MTAWVLRGLRAGVATTPYPDGEETARGVTPGRPRGAPVPAGVGVSLVSRCPTGALAQEKGEVAVEFRRCVHCFRCVRETDSPLPWEMDAQWGQGVRGDVALGPPWSRSLHILVVDAGDCGACLQEVRQLSGPYYNLHRLGFFITPSPRRADILLVVGAVTVPMVVPLTQAYEAMPTPKRVIAVGACALSGGVFGPSFACRGGVGEVLPVDVEVPGCPPPPLAILHGLLVAAGRVPAVRPAFPKGGCV